MRHLATLPEEAARTLADYLLTLKIQTRVQPEADGMAVWVCDEDQVAPARQELDEFKRNPDDPRYRSAGPVADTLRRQEESLETDYRKRQQRMQNRMRGMSLAHRPVTNLLIALSIVVTLATNFGKVDNSIAQALYFSSFTVEETAGGSVIAWNLPFSAGGSLRSGEVWRLITPIFLHLGVLHLVFNMMMLLSLGGAVEYRRGSLRLLWLVLVLAIGSNLGQYYLGGSRLLDGRFLLGPSPLFGGMSGVLYGLFGYLWMKSRFEPELGLGMPAQTVLIMVGWFFLCWLVIPRVANFAHTFGLLLGLAIGCAPGLWRRLRGG